MAENIEESKRELLATALLAEAYYKSKLDESKESINPMDLVNAVDELVAVKRATMVIYKGLGLI